MVRAGQVLAMDTATRPKPGHVGDKQAGLSPLTGQLRLVQITDGEKILIFDMAHIPTEVLCILREAQIVFHDAQFDLAFLLTAGVRLKETSCTQLMIAALTHRPMISLAQACQEYLGVQVDKALQVSGWMSEELLVEQVEYAAQDAFLTLALYKVLLKQLTSDGLMAGFKLVRRCIPAIVDATARGLLLDVEAHRALVSR
jgi:ribonuclease D